VTQSKRLNLNLNRSSGKAIGDDHYISLQDLVQLKEDLADPPERLVLALKSLLKGVAEEAAIDECLVIPFCPRT
jgi:hypothetical protein